MYATLPTDCTVGNGQILSRSKRQGHGSGSCAELMSVRLGFSRLGIGEPRRTPANVLRPSRGRGALMMGVLSFFAFFGVGVALDDIDSVSEAPSSP